MRSVVMHVDGAGVIWALAKCRVCGEVHKYLAADAITSGVNCKSCKHPMELAGAVIAAGSSERDRPTTADAHAKPDGHGLAPEQAD